MLLCRYPPGIRRLGHKRSNHASSQQARYYPNQQQQVTHPQTGTSPLVSQQQQQQQQQQSFQRDISSTATSAPPTKSTGAGESLLVAYTMEGYANTMAKRLPVNQLFTLADFKEKVFQRRGFYRFVKG